MSTVLDVLDFIMLAVFFSAITICLLIYKGQRSKAFLFIGLYFVAQVLLELEIRTSEVDNHIIQWLNQVFSKTVILKGLTYGGLILVMLLAALSILKITPKPRHFIVPGIILIWLILTCSLQSVSLVLYWSYLIPCEAFYFGLCIFVLKQMKKRPGFSFHPALKTVMKLIIVFSVLIALEDILFTVYYDLNIEYHGFTVPGQGVPYVKERSFTESALQLILGVIAICSGGGILVNSMGAAPDTLGVSKDSGLDMEAFALHLGLSPREREVLPLLLSNMDINQISEKLIISHGTVKSHTHNIYKKANVQNRVGLLKLASDFKVPPQ